MGLEKVDEDIIEVKTTRSGRKIKPVIPSSKVGKDVTSRRSLHVDDSEEDEVEVKEISQTRRKKRKSSEMEVIEVVDDVKRTRSGRIVKELVKIKGESARSV